jgi:hypothetical protein
MPRLVIILPSANDTDARALHPSKALSGRLETPAGTSIPVKPVLAKASAPMVVSALSYGKKIPLSVAQFLKASSGIVVTVKGTIRFPSLPTLLQLKAEQPFPLPKVEKGVDVLQILQPLAPAEEVPL